MSFLEHIEAVLITTLLAALVWLWAEGKDVQTYDGQIVPIQLVAPPGFEGELVIEPAEIIRAEAAFETSSAQFDLFLSRLRDGAIAITIPPPEIGNTRTAPLSLRAQLQAELFDPLHIDLDDLEPAAFPVRVDRIVDAELDIALSLPPGVTLPQPATLQPATASVRLPASLLDAAAAPVLTARLPIDAINAAEPGQPQSVTLALALPDALRSNRSELRTPAVEVTFTVPRRTATTTLETLPIKVTLSPLVLRRWNVTVDDDQLFVRDIELRGPAATIAAINTGTLPVSATFEPSVADLEQGLTSKPIDITVPPGVEVISTTPQASFTATPRSSAPTN
ncbi:MAG: hypothetical protein AAF823_12930 [Planctomycetota bacterium]